MRKNNLIYEELKEQFKEWDDIPLDVIPEKDKEIFSKRKRAVEMYFDGFSSEEILKQTGIERPVYHRLIKKGMQIDDNGDYYGYGVFIPYRRASRTNHYDSYSKGPGQFSSLMEKYPELRKHLMGCYYGDKKYTLERNMNFISIHQRFLQKCRSLKIPDYEYPFNTDKKGYESMIRYIKSEAARDIANSSKREIKDIQQKVMSTGHGIRYSKNPFAPYQRVQVDGHIIDLGYNIQIDNGDGTYSKVMATRAWMFAVIDVATRAIIGYSVSQEFNYNQTDVLRAIRNAIEPHEKMNLTISGFKYPANGGFPSLAFPELEYSGFSEIMMDNAKSHLAKNTVAKLVDTLNTNVNFGSVATPETRGIVERFFGTLETKGFHRVPGTTGSNIKDPKRDSPETKCIKYDITFDEICELLEILVTEYNNAPHKSLHNETPMQAMERLLTQSCFRPYQYADAQRKEISRLTCFVVKRIVKGGVNKGKRPYIQYESAIYRNNTLTAGDGFVGKEITLYVDPEDVSSVEAYTDDGTYLGVLKAIGEYGRKSHSLKSRKAMAKLACQNKRKNYVFATPVTDYEDHLREKASTSRRDATKADILRRELGKPEVEKQIEEQINHKVEIIDISEHHRSSVVTSTGKPMTIPEFVKKFREEHNGELPEPEDFLELSKMQQTV